MPRSSKKPTSAQAAYQILIMIIERVRCEDIPKQISRVGLGTWAIGGSMWGGSDEAESIKTIQRALDRGINLVDTAPAYGFGRSEEIVGKALAEGGRRDKAVLATKVGLEWSNGKVYRNSTPARIRQEIEDSLRRLRTDRIDLYQVHWPDPMVPIEETAATLVQLQREGKVLALGVSNYSPDQMNIWRRVAPLHSIQPPYNIFEREIETGVLPYALENKLLVLSYGAICRGLLSGKMKPDRRFEGDDLRLTDPKFQQPRFFQYLAAADRLARYAQESYGRSLLAFAIRWILDRGETMLALWGARHASQLDAAAEVFGWKLTGEDYAEVDKILRETIADPVGPEFMAPRARTEEARSCAKG
jgi:aryl-alcohol dehydrogenase-like predicted oxidoreductase